MNNTCQVLPVMDRILPTPLVRKCLSATIAAPDAVPASHATAGFGVSRTTWYQAKRTCEAYGQLGRLQGQPNPRRPCSDFRTGQSGRSYPKGLRSQPP